MGYLQQNTAGIIMPTDKPLMLIVLDGWGHTESKQANAITSAKTPNWDRLWAENPHMLISASGLDVGLPPGQMGNSEVGHMTLGAGRVIYQDLTLINNAIEDGIFFQNKILLDAINIAKRNNSSIHILGLVSPGGIHSHQNQIFAMLKMCAEQHASSVFVHAFLDGRDTPPQSAKNSLLTLQQVCAQNHANIASIMGRFYAMDRDKRTERTTAALELLTQAKSEFQAPDAITGLELAYDRGETDEFVKPTLINPSGIIKSGDVVIFMNFRADRARQLTTGLTNITPQLIADFVTLTEYDPNLPVHVAFPKSSINNVLGAILEQHKLTQLRIAETEKYAHVTFFFNAGREQPFNGEDRIMIPSPKVSTYDLAPAMAANEITDQIIAFIENKKFDVIICNFANADMLGHTGKMEATIESIQTLDNCLGRIVAALKQFGGQALITADHGNAEIMWDEKSQQPHTAHTSNLVPIIYVGEQKIIFNTTKHNCALRDVAPTMLELLKISIPNDMTGSSLISKNDP